MFILYIGVILLTRLCQQGLVAEKGLIVVPANEFRVEGEEAAFTCESTKMTHIITMTHERTGVPAEVIGIVSATEIKKFTRRMSSYRVERNLTETSIMFILTVLDIKISDAGIIACTVPDVAFQYTSRLVVSSFTTQRSSLRDNSVVVGAPFSLTCHLYYCGSGWVQLYFESDQPTDADEEEFHVHEVRSYDLSLGEYEKTLNVSKATHPMEGRVYYCVTTVELSLPAQSTGLEKRSITRPHSDFNVSYPPMLIYYPPTVDVFPKGSRVFHVGDRLTMTATGHPTPTIYLWVGLSINLNVSAQRLTISRHMVGKNVFNATASTLAHGMRLVGAKKFDFEVLPPPPRPTTTTNRPTFMDEWEQVGKPPIIRLLKKIRHIRKLRKQTVVMRNVVITKTEASTGRDLNMLLLKLFFAISLMLGSIQGAMVLRRKLKKRNSDMDDSFEPDGNEEEADDEAAAEVYQTSGEPAEGGDEPGPKATAKPNTVFPGGTPRPSIIPGVPGPDAIPGSARPSITGW